MKPLCIYHGNCADGFTSAWAVWRRLRDLCDYYPGVYSEPPPNVEGRIVLMCDFSYKYEVMKQIHSSARAIVILDHHKTAIEDIVSKDPGDSIVNSPRLTWEVFQEEVVTSETKVPLHTVFDYERSGAGITWDFMHAGTPAPALVSYVQDRDLWRFKLPSSREINACIFSHSYDFHAWDRIASELETSFDKIVSEGEAIERKHRRDLKELIELTKRRAVIAGHEVWVANLPHTYASDAAGMLAKGEPFAACYWDTDEGRVFSLRSSPVGLDVSEIAKAFGGGGHKHAAGFKIKMDIDLNTGAKI